MISIIIPTKNEEECLPFLLSSIKYNLYKGDYEIIISDANSTDNTLKIAKEFNCKIVKGGLPAIGRNNGGRIAKGDVLLFIDADMVLPTNFLNLAINELNRRNIDISYCDYIPFDSKSFIDKLLYYSANRYLQLTSYFYPHASGMFIIVRANIFKKVKGFNKKVVMAEDHDFIMRASKLGIFRRLKSVFIYSNIRRLKKEGRYNLFRKYFICELYRIFNDELYKCPISYKLQGDVELKK